MSRDIFADYLRKINEAYLRGDATEHTHRPALKMLVESLAKNVTATNEPRRVACGAPDFIVSQKQRRLDRTIGYIECKDIGTSLKDAARSEQIKKRYLPSLHNIILTDYIEFWWYVDGEKRGAARLGDEQKQRFRLTEQGQEAVADLFECFFAQEPDKITTAKELAMKMAHKARMLRDLIARTFEEEEETGSLHGQYEGFKEVLLHDLSEEHFADMYAQTVSYGLFTARCHIDEVTLYGKDKHAVFHGMNGKPGEFTREHAAFMLPKTNPFLRSVFGHIAGPDLDERVAWLVDDLVELLRQADMGQVLRDFAKRKGRRDPVVHFYETFLAEYDPKMRKKRGVYYTPDEVVSYIVRSVDWLLKERFALKRGLADESKVTVNGKESHKVLVLDPAVGTGTFLFETIDLIHGRFKRQKGMWSAYVREHLLPRLFGFEIQIAPYAVCHMKLGLELAETGYDFESDERLGIYLTNTLEEAEEISKNVFVQWLSAEARAANTVKKDLPIMVVMGNPPYAGLSVNMNEWTERLLKQKLPGEDGAQSYYEVDGKPLRERKVWLQDDYVKFIRFGQWRIEQSGKGILALITNHGYLDNPTFRGMRQSLMQTFDEIYVLDLHGNSRRKETCPDGSKDENVFDIEQGVAIGIFVRRGHSKRSCVVYHADGYGLRRQKRKLLEKDLVCTTRSVVLEPKPPYYLFVEGPEGSEEYLREFTKTNEVFPVSVAGIVTARDGFAIDLDKDALVARILDFCDLTQPDIDVKSKYRLSENYSWRVADARRCLDEAINKQTCAADFVRTVCYRPFDVRHVFYHRSVVWRTRPDVMCHMSRGQNLALCAVRNVEIGRGWEHVLCSREMIDHHSVSLKEVNYLYPLYLYQEAEEKKQRDMDYENWPRGKGGRVPNLSREFVEHLAKEVGMEFVSDGRGDVKDTFGPEDVFEYVYAVLYSPDYRRRYAEFLKIDFPRIPWPKDKEIFGEARAVGGELVRLHLMEAEVLEDETRWPTYALEGDNLVEKGYPKYVAHAEKAAKAKVHINKDQYFEGVKPDVWEFHIGGYQVCEKWLKDRRGRELSYQDISHYQKVVVALEETIRLMKQPCLRDMFEEHKS